MFDLTSTTFDLISDLNLKRNDFDWGYKAASSHCIIAGNISADLNICRTVIEQLLQKYMTVFFIDGALENSVSNRDAVVDAFYDLTARHERFIYLYDEIAINDGIAILGLNGWHGGDIDLMYEDVAYLTKSLDMIDDAADVESVIIVSGTIPLKELGKLPIETIIGPTSAITSANSSKITKWVYGGGQDVKNATISGIQFISNPRGTKEYYAAIV